MNTLIKLTENQNHILSILQHGYGGEFCYNYKNLEGDTGLDRDTLKTEIKQLKEMGLVETLRGLMTEDGFVAGSGFTIPYKKYAEIKDLLKY